MVKINRIMIAIECSECGGSGMEKEGGDPCVVRNETTGQIFDYCNKCHGDKEIIQTTWERQGD